MQVFHGSYTEIFDVDFAKSQSNKDFGKGFYVTKFRNHAETWATNVARRYHKTPFVTEFIFYERAYEDERYKVLRFSDYCEAWFDFIILNRNPETTAQKHDYDIIEGPIADDKIQNRIIDFFDGLITKADFLNELKYHEETHQLCFCTVNSLQMLKKIDTKYSSCVVRISEQVIESLISDLSIDEAAAADIFYTSNAYVRLSDPTAGIYKNDWTEIYKVLKKEMVSMFY
ncbi:MAG: DUF3990 domain-containing protein [Prevotellaceae bacterium]|jgi:hypothetical protein|nr:DUF3990 domain-containing protein [Prevotellaceae bacterium]